MLFDLYFLQHKTCGIGYIANPKVPDNGSASITVIKISDLRHREEKLYLVCQKYPALLQLLLGFVWAVLFSGLCCVFEEKWPGPEARAGPLWGRIETLRNAVCTQPCSSRFRHTPLHPAFHRRCGRSTPSLWTGGREGRRAEA